MTDPAITSIVFDLGWVFVRLNYRPFLEFLSVRGAHAPDMDTVISGSLGTIAYIERNAGSHTITVGLSLATLPFLASAIYGYVQTSRCHRYKSIFQ